MRPDQTEAPGFGASPALFWRGAPSSSDSLAPLLCTLLRFPPVSACRCVNALMNATVMFGGAAARGLFTCAPSGGRWDKKNKKAELAASQ